MFIPTSRKSLRNAFFFLFLSFYRFLYVISMHESLLSTLELIYSILFSEFLTLQLNLLFAPLLLVFYLSSAQDREIKRKKYRKRRAHCGSSLRFVVDLFSNVARCVSPVRRALYCRDPVWRSARMLHLDETDARTSTMPCSVSHGEYRDLRVPKERAWRDRPAGPRSRNWIPRETSKPGGPLISARF